MLKTDTSSNEIVRQNEEEEKLKWVTTPDGLANIHGFFSNDRIGVVLKSELETKSEVPVRFYKSDQVLPAVSLDEPKVPPPQEKKRQMEEKWDFREIQIDGTTDKWMVGTRLDKPGKFKFWATNHPSSCDDNPQEKIEDRDL